MVTAMIRQESEKLVNPTLASETRTNLEDHGQVKTMAHIARVMCRLPER
jgi:hypothetical protein